MQTKPPMEPSGSPVPGVIPEPIRVHRDSAPAPERGLAAPKPSATERGSSPRRRNPASILLARLLSTVRGDKYLADASPPTRRMSAAARVGSDAVEAQPDTAGQTAPPAPQTKER